MATPGGRVVGRVIAAVCQSGVVDDQVAVLEAASAVFVPTRSLSRARWTRTTTLGTQGSGLSCFG